MKLEVDTSRLGGWIKRHSRLVLVAIAVSLSWFAAKQIDEELVMKWWWGLICLGTLIATLAAVIDYADKK